MRLLFLSFTKIAKLNSCEMFYNPQIAKLNTYKMFFFKSWFNTFKVHKLSNASRIKINETMKFDQL